MRGEFSAGWTRGKIIERFRETEHIMGHHMNELLSKGKAAGGWNREENELASAIQHYESYAQNLVRYFEEELTRFEMDKLIPCPNCSRGVATITAGNEVTCDWCSTLFYPRHEAGFFKRKIAWEEDK